MAENINFISLTKIDTKDWRIFDADYTLYSSLQVHYHTPSEHTINGMHYDLEMHMVHQFSDMAEMYKPNNTEDTMYYINESSHDLAVIGVLFYEDPDATEDVFDHLLMTVNETD